jgi:hypothetical protein
MINSKGIDSETSWYSVNQLFLFFVLILKQSLCAFVGCSLILIGAQFLPILQMFCTFQLLESLYCHLIGLVDMKRGSC